jgi:glycosyltransferase involved in cell wall biosynthesis
VIEENFFSVVVPLFNKQSVVLDTINSVINQNYQNFELIVVNDGSTDRSLDIVNQNFDGRVKVVDQSNAGVAAARNAGVKHAKGDWVAFLDADDLWASEHLSHLDELIKTVPDVVMVSSSSRKVPPKFQLSQVKNTESDYRYTTSFFKRESQVNFPVNSSSVAVKRKVLSKLGGFLPYSSGEDVEMWARVALTGRVCISNFCSVYYRQDLTSGLSGKAIIENRLGNQLGGMSSTPVLRMIKERIKSNALTVDSDLKEYICFRLEVGLKVRFAKGDIKGLRELLRCSDWKSYCSPSKYDFLRYLPDFAIRSLRVLYFSVRK